MPDELEAIEKFILFSKTASTKGGFAFRYETFEIGQNNKPTVVKGKVYLKGNLEQTEIPVEMHWDLKGAALLLGTQYDLVTESPFNELD